jgi:hypothetical protein
LAGVAGSRARFAGQVAQIEVSEGVQPVIDGDHHHVVMTRQVLAVIGRPTTRAIVETTAVKPDHHRTFF